MFTIVDVTRFQEAIAAAINLDPDLDLNLNPESGSNPKSDAAVLSINPMSVPVEYANHADVFEEKEILQLPPHHPGVDLEIPLARGSKSFYGSIYNLSETKLRYLKEYID